MKVIFNCHAPFMLAHGGLQIQIDQTQKALQAVGVSVEPLRWWDANQTGDIFHHFGRIPKHLLLMARQKEMKVVVADLLTAQGSRSRLRLATQGLVIRLLQRMLPAGLTATFGWESYQLADACIALTPWEARLLSSLFGAPPEKVHVVANGVEDVFLHSPAAQRGLWMVCTATITERKRVLELAEAAVQAQTPLWVVGRPYSDSDPYSQRFLEFARTNPKFIRFEGAIKDRARMAQIYREARGFVLLSAMESLSLSALEAAACECPLLLSDLPWARTVFGRNASYCPVPSSNSQAARHLRTFYDRAPDFKPPAKPASWSEIATQLRAIYERLLQPNPSRDAFHRVRLSAGD
jgi:glycosyltransferase involved in cell wall biosynthesis